jgi:hypothetical protein
MLMNLLAISLSATMSFSALEAEELKKVALASFKESRGFQLKHTEIEPGLNSDVELTYRRPSDRARLRLRLFRVSSTDKANSIWNLGLAMQALYEDLPVAFSGYRIGDATRRYASGSRTALDTRLGSQFVVMTIEYGTKLDTPINTPARAADRAFCEGVTRRAVAGLANLEVTQARSSSSRLTGPKGETLVDLAAYVRQTGGSVKFDRQSEIAVVTKGGKEAVVPLGSSQVAAGKRVVTAEDVTVVRGGKWYVPLSALRKAL